MTTTRYLKSMRTLGVTIGGLLGFAVVGVGVTAHAADGSVTCAPTVVAYGSNVLNTICGGVTYTAQTAAPAGCSAQSKSVDTLKAMENLLTSAELANRSVVIFFHSCINNTGHNDNYLTEVDLK